MKTEFYFYNGRVCVTISNKFQQVSVRECLARVASFEIGQMKTFTQSNKKKRHSGAHAATVSAIILKSEFRFIILSRWIYIMRFAI